MPHVKHTDPVKTALAAEEILHENSLATVTKNYIVVRRRDLRAQAIIRLPQITKLKRIVTTNPGYLVIAAAIYLLAAAAALSKQGDKAGLPFAALATIFVAVYFVTRRAAVVFVADGQITETSLGTFSEAAAVVNAIATELPDVVAAKPLIRRRYSLTGITAESSNPPVLTLTPRLISLQRTNAMPAKIMAIDTSSR